MRIFACPDCGGRLFFENRACVCGAEVVFDPQAERFSTDLPRCHNRAEIGCNWMAAKPDGGYCRACAMTEVIPETFHSGNLSLWSEAERAKRWVLTTLGRWGWFTASDPGPRPVFRLLAETTSAGAVAVPMGHAAGVVTINVTEADPAELVQRREVLGERLRTMIGHFRHELGHFVFERLSARAEFLENFRALFGDERPDYAEALDAYYRDGPAEGWSRRHLTAYASSHPHEDWAESFAHLLHLTDIVDSFVAAGFSSATLSDPEYDAYAEADPKRLVTLGASLGIGLNHVNRAMGLSDIYPFVLTSEIRTKLAFAHSWIRASAGATP